LTIRPGENSVVKSDNIPTKKVAEKVKTVISGIITVKILPNNDIKVILENPLQKEKTIRIFKILK